MEQLGSSQDLARMLAEYRARGGRIQQREASDPFSTSSPQSRAADVAPRPPLKSDADEDKSGRHTDMNWASKVKLMESLLIHAAGHVFFVFLLHLKAYTCRFKIQIRHKPP